MSMSKQKMRLEKPILIMLYGFPGAGKTHFSHNLVNDLDAAHIHGDRIRNELFEDPRYDAQEDAIVKQLMTYMAEEFLNAGVSVIFDANAMRKTQRHEIREIARKKKAKTLLVWFQMDPDTAFQRLKNRDRRTADDKYAVEYTPETFKQIASRMQHPLTTEDFVVVSGKHTYNSQRSVFFHKLVELGYANRQEASVKVAKPGMINLVPHTRRDRLDMTSRRNINIR